MRKSDIVLSMAEELDLTQVKAEQVFDAIIDEIKAALSRGETVTLRRFGVFSVRAKDTRVGRNPKTGEIAEIKARRVVRFKPGSNFKDAVNGALD